MVNKAKKRLNYQSCGIYVLVNAFIIMTKRQSRTNMNILSGYHKYYLIQIVPGGFHDVY